VLLLQTCESVVLSCGSLSSAHCKSSRVQVSLTATPSAGQSVAPYSSPFCHRYSQRNYC